MSEEQTQEIQKRQPGPLDSLKAGLFSQGSINIIADVLPGVAEASAKKEAGRILKLAYAVISTNPTLQQCTFQSIVRSVAQSASVGLPVDNRGLAYLVPFRNKDRQWEAQLIISYTGLMDLAYRSNKVKSISANVIFESEKDKVKIERIDGRFNVEHPFSWEEPSGDVIAAYATAEIEGLGPQTTVLRRDEIERHRAASKAPDSPAWKNWYPEMAKKSAVRVLAKFLPKSIVDEMQKGFANEVDDNFVTASQLNEAIITAQSGTKRIDVDISDTPKEQEADGETEPEATFLGDDAEKDPDTKAKAEAEKAKLAASDEKTAKYVCKNTKCGAVFENPKFVKKGKAEVPQCPECLRTNVGMTEAA
jgi:phage RecT family recombinase